MQTFLPYTNFRKCAGALDWRRLGKQRVEAKMIMEILLETKYPVDSRWKNHPAVKMWKGYIGALAWYGIEMCLEWKRRGYEDNLLDVFIRHAPPWEEVEMPWWIGNTGSGNIGVSHRSNLIRKDPAYYGKVWPRLRDDKPYFWPVK